MIRYIVSDLDPSTPQADQDKLLAALKAVKGIKDVRLTPAASEITFGIHGPEPKAKLLEEACDSAGFTLGART